jgi:phage-related protein
VKTISFHIAVLKDIENLDFSIRKQILELLAQLSDGVKLGMPASRPMPSVYLGVHELRVKDRIGQYRIFYYLKCNERILVFHIFKKKTQATPLLEIKTAQRRLKDML